MRYEDSYFRYFSYKLKNTQLLGTKVILLLVPNNTNYENDIKTIIINNQEKSFIHIILRNLHTLKENQLNIYKKVELFILKLCELKPELVNWFSYVGTALEIETAMNIYDLDSLLRSLFYDETKFDYSTDNNSNVLQEKYKKDRNELKEYILSDKYDINVMSIFLTKARNHIEYLIFSNTDYESWSKHIINSYITKFESMTEHELFSNDILYTIKHLSQMNHTYLIDYFAKYLNSSKLYKEWLAHIVYYKDGKFEFSERFVKQFDLDKVGESKIILDKCDKIKKKKICQDLMSIIDEGLNDVETNTHPYLEYVKDYWNKNIIAYNLDEHEFS